MSVLPGSVCPTCERKVPHVHDKSPGPKQSRFSVAVPPGEEGVLEEMLVACHERIEPIWPSLGGLGDRGWRYRDLALILHAVSECNPGVLAALIGEEGG